MTTETMTAQREEKDSVNTTFRLDVMYQKNHSWQGRITWLESNQTESFRSELELLKLISSAIELRRDAQNEASK